MILFKDILTFLELYYRDAFLITLYLVVIGISITKSRRWIIKTYKSLLSKSKNQHVLHERKDLMVTIMEWHKEKG